MATIFDITDRALLRALDRVVPNPSTRSLDFPGDDLGLSAIDESWLIDAVTSFWQSPNEDGFTHIPCPEQVRQQILGTSSSRMLRVYLPTSLHQGFIVTGEDIEARKTCRIWRWYSLIVGGTGWALLLPSHGVGLVVVSVIVFFVLVPTFIYVPWEFAVRRRSNRLSFSAQLCQAFSAGFDEIERGESAMSVKSKTASAIAGAIAKGLGGELAAKLIEVSAERTVESLGEDHHHSLEAKAATKAVESLRNERQLNS